MSVGKKILILIVYNIIAFIIAFIITYPVVKITEYDALSIIFFVILFALLLMFPNPEKSIFANKNNLNSFLNRLNKLDNVNEIQEDMNFGTHEESLVTHEEITDKPKVVSVSGNSTFGVFLKNNIFTGRIFHLNLGVQRLLLVIGIFLPLIISINKYEFFEYFPDDFFLVILFSILLFIGYWVIVRISLWIYDGFKEGDKNK